MKIILDPGHGGRDWGGGGNTYWREKDMNLKISQYQQKLFEEAGIECVLTRTDDIYLSPAERTQIVRNSGADICLSNHINLSGYGTAEGAETIYSIHSKGILAKRILDYLGKAGQKVRRTFSKESTKSPGTDYYFMHRNTGSVQTIIVEYGFADHKKDTERLLMNWQAYAKAVVDGVLIHIDHLSRKTEQEAFVEALKVLVEKEIIQTPDYWRLNAIGGCTIRGDYARQLILNASKALS